MPPRPRSATRRKTSANPHVALIIETSKIYGREILTGIGKYIQLHEPWSTYITERGQDDEPPPWLATWEGDGIITRSYDPELCRQAQARGIPVVSLRHLLEQPDFPTIFPDQSLIGSRIAEHLIERGFENFGYLGVPGDKAWEALRREAFVASVKARGCPDVAIGPVKPISSTTWEDHQEEIADWLRLLPKPVGIMVNHDVQGIQVLDACRRSKLRVPDEVAVVSVDNDTVLCNIADPPLSSLDQNVQRLGFEAAEMLDAMMRGEKAAPSNHFVEPLHVVTRQSSDVIAVNDERLSRAIRFIRENACKGVDVNLIARAAGISRRALEKKFIERIGRTPLEEVQEIRFRRVRQLLLETDYTLSQIAELAGFQYQEYLVRFFKKRSGLAPGQYRRKLRFDT